MDVKKCNVCNKKIDKDNYKKIEIYVRTVTIRTEKNIGKTFFRIDINQKKRPNNTNTTTFYHQPKFEKVINRNNKNRKIVIGFSNCGKTYLLNYILLQKQEAIFKLQNH